MSLRSAAAFIFAAFIFSSCEKDMSAETGALSYYSASPNASLTGNADCKDCVYIPVCSGSVYHYSDTTTGSAGNDINYTFQFLKDTTIEGKTYHKYSGENGAISYYNCTAGVTSAIQYNVASSGGSIAAIKIRGLEANQPVGGTWTDLISNGSGQNVSYNYTIVSKGTARTVAGVAYTDVIHVHIQTMIDVPGGGTLPAGQTEYYFAKGKGLIESTIYDDFSGTQVEHRVLISAMIP